MAFFYNATRGEVKKPKAPTKMKGPIPIQSLQALGCSVCPRAKDDPLPLSPKLKPSGTDRPTVYLLGTSPSDEDDDQNNHWCDKAGQYIYDQFGDHFMRMHARSNFITQCFGDQTEASVECCRPRIVADIEESRPSIIVTFGDAPLRWILGPEAGGVSALTHHGSMIVTKVGNHTCWLFPIYWPRFVAKIKAGRGYRKSEHQLVFDGTVKRVRSMVEHELIPPLHWVPKPTEYLSDITIVDPGVPGPRHLAILEEALNRLKQEPSVGIDIETNGLRPCRLDKPLLLTCAIGTVDFTVAFPLDHPKGWGSEAQRRRAWELLIDFLLTSGKKIAHNLAMELEWFEYFLGRKAIRELEWEDSMAVAHTLDERPGTKSLNFQTRLVYGFWLKVLSRVDSSRILDYPLKDVLIYNGADAKWTHGVFNQRIQDINAEPAYQLEYDRKVRLATTLVEVEARGMLLDDHEVERHYKRLTEQTRLLEGKIGRTDEVRRFEARGRGRFEATNPDHVLILLRDICKRSEIKVEDWQGNVKETTSADVLETIPASEVPSVPLILEHRGAAKLLSTYIVPARRRDWVATTGMVHCKYASMVAVTGRLASEDPNQQNWPKRKDKEIRSVFVAPPGHRFWSFDYGQIEFRVVGMASEDPNLVRACWTGYDVHEFWAKRIVDLYPRAIDWIVREFKVDWDEKGLKTLRQETKNKWVFPQLFGAAVQSCAEQLHLPDHVAEELAGEFWDEFRVAKKWQEKLLQSYERNLYVETLSGRRRRGAMTKNEIINMPIQGTAADIVTEGMNGVSERGYLEDRNHLTPVLNVHDDLSYYLPGYDEDASVKIIAEEMCRVRFDWINVPLVIEASVGSNWYDQKEVAKYWSNEIYPTRNPYA